MRSAFRRDQGFAVVVAMMATLMISAIAAALVLATTTDALIARNFRDGATAMYAAEAIALRTIDDLAAAPDWSAVLDGSARSPFFDGGAGRRTLADGSTIDLTAIVNVWNCGKGAACTGADMTRTTVERPWGGNNPQWRIYACGRLADLAPGVRSTSREYVLLLVADDPSETDGDSAVDGLGAANPGSGVLLLRGEAFGAGGSHAVVDVTVARAGPRLRIVSWRLGR